MNGPMKAQPAICRWAWGWSGTHFASHALTRTPTAFADLIG
jgi:hypothetical protein